MWKTALAAIVAAAICSCAARQDNREERPVSASLRPSLRAEQSEFALDGRREIKVIYSLQNTSARPVRLDFPTAQHLEVLMRGPDGRQLFAWSEDRSFAGTASSVVVNPGERLEYEADVPTRDMLSGRAYTVVALLPGHEETGARVTLAPR